MTNKKHQAKLVLEDGCVFSGWAFGATGERTGEVVFNTSMAGYQEILTDPSYKGQIVTMTYPLIGNYGVNREDFESACPHVEGFAIRELSEIYSNFRAQDSLDGFLREHGIIGIEGIDTRALTRRIRVEGAMRGILSTEDLDDKSLTKKAQNSPKMKGQDLAREVTCSESYEWSEGFNSKFSPVNTRQPNKTYNAVAIDYGVKHNILRWLVECGCRLTVVPASTTAADILARKPDGVFLSNGPGDPAAVPYAAECIKELLGQVPIFGICLGHQILAIALGGSTFKLKFGHRGANQPVLNLATQKVEITSQNHGFAVDMDSLDTSEIELSHINLNDNTLEGFRHKKLPAYSVQYHPEASPGPHEASYLFHQFATLMDEQTS